MVIVSSCHVPIIRVVCHQLLADMFIQLDCGGLDKYLQVLGDGVIATFIQQHFTDSLRSIMLYAVTKTLEQDEEIEDEDEEDDDEDDDDPKDRFQQLRPCLLSKLPMSTRTTHPRMYIKLTMLL